MSGRRYSDEFRAHVVDVYVKVGLSEAERRTGVDRTTILRWARAAELDPAEVSQRISQQNASAAAASAAKRQREMEEARERMLLRLLKIREAAGLREMEVLAKGGFDKSSLRDLTLARTNATKDAELLGGFATTRSENLVDGRELLGLVQLALDRALEQIPAAVRDQFSAVFAHELREARENAYRLALEPAVVEGELAGEEEQPA